MSTNRTAAGAPLQTPEPEPPERPMPTNVIQAIARIIEEMPAVGKDAQYDGGGSGNYSYRSIEGVTAALHTLMGRYGVVPVPKVLRRVTKDVTVGGKPWTQEELELVYRVHGPAWTPGPDGVPDWIEVGPLFALGRDNSDKGTNKAMTQAFKQGLLQVFVVADNQHDGDRERAESDDRPVDPERWFTDTGWMDREHHDTERDAFGAAWKTAPAEVKAAMREWYGGPEPAAVMAEAYSPGVEPPAWNAAWPRPFLEAVAGHLADLLARHQASGAAEAPQEPQEGQGQAPAPEPPAEPETAAPGPHSAPTEPGAMPWDGVTDPGDEAKDAQAREEARKLAVLAYVNTLKPQPLEAQLRARNLDLTGTPKERKQRLARALVASGWQPPRA